MSKKLYEEFHKNSTFISVIPKKNNFTYKHVLKFINKHINENFSKKIKILDIGCGVGSLSYFLAKKGHDVLGVDISDIAIESAKKSKLHEKYKTRFKKMNIENGIGGNEKFDLVLMSEVIEHIKNEGQALKYVQKVMKKNGILIITTPSVNAPLYRMNLLKEFDSRVGHVRRYSQSSLRKSLKKADFNNIIGIKKNEGIFRNFLYTFKLGSFPVRVLNKFPLLGHIYSFIDGISIFLFGESNIFMAIKK